MNNPTNAPSKLLDYLPEIYGQDAFLGQFLLAFEKILLGDKNDITIVDSEGKEKTIVGLEQKIANLPSYFDPKATPADFLPWLASWTALSLRADLDELQQRDFIANIVPRYRKRGTKENVQELLKIFIKGTPTITETSNVEFQIGKVQLYSEKEVYYKYQLKEEELKDKNYQEKYKEDLSVVANGPRLGGGIPHFFTVEIAILKGLPTEQRVRQGSIARAIIDQEKPAHTDYELKIIEPDTIKLGSFGQENGSRIGIDSILGNIPENPQEN
ncbi:MAG: phage tail protein [Crocosphaera sp.]